jgi:hypothetical protein
VGGGGGEAGAEIKGESEEQPVQAMSISFDLSHNQTLCAKIIIECLQLNLSIRRRQRSFLSNQFFLSFLLRSLRFFFVLPQDDQHPQMRLREFTNLFPFGFIFL